MFTRQQRVLVQQVQGHSVIMSPGRYNKWLVIIQSRLYIRGAKAQDVAEKHWISDEKLEKVAEHMWCILGRHVANIETT